MAVVMCSKCGQYHQVDTMHICPKLPGTNRLLSKDEILAELHKLDDVSGSKAGYVINDLEIMRKIDGRSVSYNTTDLLMPMSQFSERILVPLVYAKRERFLDPNVFEPTNAYRVPRPEDVRGSTHGDYNRMSQTIQEIKGAMRSGPSWGQCSAAQREALELIATKIGRIVCGDPGHHDHWDDLAGYARKARETIPERK